MRLRIGTSTEADAGGALAAAARGALGASVSPAFALVFSTFDYPAEEVALAANEALGSTPWAGLVTAAILADGHVMRRGIAVGVLDCERLRVRVGAPEPSGNDARDIGRRAAREALAGMPLPPADRSRAMLLFADTKSRDAAEVVHGALSVAGAGIAWCGGGTGSLDPGGSAAQFANGRALRDHVVAVTLDCHARVGVGIKHGWQPTGPPAMVTRADGTLVEELEHRPAFAGRRHDGAQGRRRTRRRCSRLRLHLSLPDARRSPAGRALRVPGRARGGRAGPRLPHVR